MSNDGLQSGHEEGRPRPHVSCNVDGIPLDLKETSRWVGWEYQNRGGKMAKIPIAAQTGTSASSTDPAGWSDFDSVVEALRRNPQWAGIGVVLDDSDDILGIDLDGCIDENGVLSKEAADLVRLFGSYAEVSPSGKGVKIFVRGKKPPNAACRTSVMPGLKQIEIYERGRYFTVTGHRLLDAPAQIVNAQIAIDLLCNQLWPAGRVEPSAVNRAIGGGFDGDDRALIAKAISTGGGKFKRLWSGDLSEYDHDHSRADLALCSLLAFWTGRDAHRMDRLFRQSGLYRDKWDRTDYRERTISKAIASCQETYDGRFRPKPAESAAMSPCDEIVERTQVVLGTDEHRVVDEVVRALGGDPELYQRGGRLVRIVREGKSDADRSPGAGALSIAPVTLAYLRDRITRAVKLMKLGKSEGVAPAHPPTWLAPQVEARRAWDAIPVLQGITTIPVLRSDGSVFQTPGYDTRTGMYYQPSCEVPQIPDAIPRDAVEVARTLLSEVVQDFPFELPIHQAAWFAALFTVVVRLAFDGPTPLFLVDANSRGAGKSLLVQLIARICQGRALPASTYSDKPEEVRKLITSVAMAAEQIACLDNLSGPFGCAPLDAALTSTRWRDRLLATNEITDLPLFTVWFATGNNVRVVGDTPRRIVHIRLEVLEEQPEIRSGFRHPNLEAWVMEHRGQLVGAVLTIVAAYIRSGKPEQGLSALGSYEGWSGLVRSSLVWAGLPDPCAARLKPSAMQDHDDHALCQFIETLAAYDSGNRGFVVADLIRTCWPADGSLPADPLLDDVREAIEQLLELAPGTRPAARKLGAALSSARRKILAGRYLDTRLEEKRCNGSLWRVYGLSSKKT